MYKHCDGKVLHKLPSGIEMLSQESRRRAPFFDDEDEHCKDNPCGFKVSPSLSRHIHAWSAETGKQGYSLSQLFSTRWSSSTAQASLVVNRNVNPSS